MDNVRIHTPQCFKMPVPYPHCFLFRFHTPFCMFTSGSIPPIQVPYPLMFERSLLAGYIHLLQNICKFHTPFREYILVTRHISSVEILLVSCTKVLKKIIFVLTLCSHDPRRRLGGKGRQRQPLRGLARAGHTMFSSLTKYMTMKYMNNYG